MERQVDPKTGYPVLSLNGFTAKIDVDDQQENPCDWDGWKVYSFNQRHASFKHPDELGVGPLDEHDQPTITDPGLRSKLKAGTAFFLSYFEHTLCAWMLMGGPYKGGVEFQWDGRRVAGLMKWEQDLSNLGPKKYEDRKKDAARFIDTYSEWCNGSVYLVHLTKDSEDEDDDEGVDVETSGSHYGLEDAEKAAEEMLNEHAKPAEVKA